MASPNDLLAGANSLLNSLTSSLDGLSSTLLGGLESKASIVSASLLSNITSLTGSLRDLIPEIPALPNIDFQSQLVSLSGIDITSGAINRISNLVRHEALSNEIKKVFGDKLTADGLDFTDQVQKALEATALGNTLSGIIPRLQADAAGLLPVEIASAIKQATSNSVADLTSTFTGNDLLKAHKEKIAEAQIAVIKALIKEDPDAEQQQI